MPPRFPSALVLALLLAVLAPFAVADPNDPPPLNIDFEQRGRVRIKWQGQANRYYQLLRSDRPDSPGQVVAMRTGSNAPPRPSA